MIFIFGNFFITLPTCFLATLMTLPNLVINRTGFQPNRVLTETDSSAKKFHRSNLSPNRTPNFLTVSNLHLILAWIFCKFSYESFLAELWLLKGTKLEIIPFFCSCYNFGQHFLFQICYFCKLLDQFWINLELYKFGKVSPNRCWPEHYIYQQMLKQISSNCAVLMHFLFHIFHKPKILLI